MTPPFWNPRPRRDTWYDSLTGLERGLLWLLAIQLACLPLVIWSDVLLAIWSAAFRIIAGAR